MLFFWKLFFLYTFQKRRIWFNIFPKKLGKILINRIFNLRSPAFLFTLINNLLFFYGCFLWGAKPPNLLKLWKSFLILLNPTLVVCHPWLERNLFFCFRRFFWSWHWAFGIYFSFVLVLWNSLGSDSKSWGRFNYLLYPISEWILLPHFNLII